MDQHAASLDIPTSRLWEQAATWFLNAVAGKKIDTAAENKS
jgi:hypothetical protein